MLKILTNSFNKLSQLPDAKIEQLIHDTVRTGDTMSMLVGKVTNILLSNRAIQSVNDGSYHFKKALMMRINEVAKACKFKTITTNKVSISNDGGMYCHPVTTITGEKELPENFTKYWFTYPEEFQDYVILKGSERKFNNNSYDLLLTKQEIDMQIKPIKPELVDLYAILLYENTKSKVKDPNYFNRLQDIAIETKCRLGMVYTNYRKLDSNSRNYPLNINGFAYEYGDAFEKWLIEPAKPWLVDETEVELAKQYLRDEFGTKLYTSLVIKAKAQIKQALEDLAKYKQGKIVNFSITHKELGKLLHIIDVNEGIIENLGNYTNTCVSYDFTNSGGINAANQFGDEKLMRVANLLGEDLKFDTHQAVADELGLARDDAKSVMQGPNHGGRVIPRHKEMVNNIFGERYKYIHMMSQYGMKLADAGVTEVVLTRPDGVKAVWYPYSIKCQVPMEDGTTVDAVMPYNSAIGTAKHRGLAVSILHSADAFTEHYIQSNLLAMGIHTKTTLDNFYGKPSIKQHIIKLTFESLELLDGYAEQQLQAIEAKTGILRGWNLPTRTHIPVPNGNIM